ncbi:hypothetical protein THAOC_15115, partial [Thalassiosira oceanica]
DVPWLGSSSIADLVVEKKLTLTNY